MSVQLTLTCDRCGHTHTQQWGIYTDNVNNISQDGWDINPDEEDLCQHCSMTQWREQQQHALTQQLKEVTQ